MTTKPKSLAIPIAVVLTMLVLVSGLAMWAGSVSATANAAIEKANANEARIDRSTECMYQIREDLQQIKTDIAWMKDKTYKEQP